MASAGTVTVDFAAETARFTAELKKVNTSLKNLEGGFSSVSRFAKGLLPVLSVGAIAGFTRQVFQAADALGDTAQRIGVSVESLSRLKFAAEQNDVEFEALATSLGRFQRTLSDATSGGKAAAGSFASLGLSAANIRNLRLEDQLAAVADAFQNVTNPADKTRIAMELFGRAGGQLVPQLNQGSEGIKQLTAEADRLGITLTASSAAGVDAADKALKKLSATVSGFFTSRLGGIALSIFGSDDELVNLQRRVEALTLQKDSFLASGDPSKTGLADEIAQIDAQLDPLLIKFKALTDLRNGVSSTSGGGPRRGPNKQPLLLEAEPFGAGATKIEETGFDLASQFNQENAEKNRQFLIATQQETIEIVNQLQIEGQRELGAALNEEIRANLETRLSMGDEFRNQELAREQAAADSMVQMRRGAFSSIIGALQAFSGQSKKAAIALVAIEKGRALAAAVMNTYQAVTLQLSTGDPYTAFGRAAAAAALGAVQIAGIAATAYGQVQSINANGGAQLGSPSNPVFTDSGDGETGSTGATSQSAIQITINGYIGRDQVNQMVDALREEIGQRDVVIIQGNSRQAMELGAGV